MQFGWTALSRDKINIAINHFVFEWEDFITLIRTNLAAHRDQCHKLRTRAKAGQAALAGGDSINASFSRAIDTEIKRTFLLFCPFLLLFQVIVLRCFRLQMKKRQLRTQAKLTASKFGEQMHWPRNRRPLASALLTEYPTVEWRSPSLSVCPSIPAGLPLSSRRWVLRQLRANRKCILIWTEVWCADCKLVPSALLKTRQFLNGPGSFEAVDNTRNWPYPSGLLPVPPAPLRSRFALLLPADEDASETQAKFKGSTSSD